MIVLRQIFCCELFFAFLVVICGVGGTAQDGKVSHHDGTHHRDVSWTPIVTETIHNGGFELGTSSSGARFWEIGFRNDPLPEDAGEAVLDDAIASQGSWSLRLQAADAEAGFFVSQICDGNANFLTGCDVKAGVDVRVDPGTQVTCAVFGLNPELPADPEWGIGLAGKDVVFATNTGGAFLTLETGFEAIGPATAVVIYCLVTGPGSVWIDQVSVTWEQPARALMQAVPEIDAAFVQRDFGWGWVNENPANLSRAADRALVGRLAEFGGDTINLFCHVRYNQLSGKDLLDGFEASLGQAARAADLGVTRVITFDFTHDSLDGIGTLNPLPDGTSPGLLSDEHVQQAMSAELLALIDAIEPQYVMVGIEIDFLYTYSPEQWPAFVSWYRDIYAAIKSEHPDILTSVYVTLESIVDRDGSLVEPGLSIFGDLIDHLDLLSYSAYFFWDELQTGTVDPSMFAAIGQLHPGLPIAIPEFGISSHTPVPDTPGDDQMGQVTFLQEILNQVSSRGCTFATLYSLYDQTYFGVPFFQAHFSHIGLYDFAGSPKLAAAWFQAIAGM